MTPEQKKHLHQAIDLARGPGLMRYVDAGRPHCVIGQLAALEGIPIERMLEWGMDTIDSLFRYGVVPELSSYPVYLLEKLQTYWDKGIQDTVCRTRMSMHREVDPCYADAAGV